MEVSLSDINARDRLGRTALLWAAWLEGTDATRRLLDGGADKEEADCYGWTPLSVAVRAGQIETVRLLLECGAVIPGPDVYGEAVLTMALRRGFDEIAVSLQEAGAEEPPVIRQARQRGINAIPLLRLEKPTYWQGEFVHFWVGVGALTEESIPKSLWNTTKLHITEPDGYQKSEPSYWPMDGGMHRGWEGRRALRSRNPEAGVYTLTFEFAGLHTDPVNISVVSITQKEADFNQNNLGVSERTSPPS